MSDAPTLRPALEADLPAIVEIYNSIIASRMVTADLSPVTVEQRRPWFVSHQAEGYPIWMLEDREGRILGWMSLDRFYARAAYDASAMIAVYLAPEYRGRGLGRWLVAEALKRAPSHGIDTLLAYIFGHNEPSLALFKHMQFETWGRLPEVAQLDGIRRDLIIMGRRCTNP